MASLIAYDDGIQIFTSEGPWLYPLLELGEYLESHPLQGNLSTYDRVVGRASALLSAGLGVTEIRTDVLSERAVPVLDAFAITVSATAREPKILCATEDLLADITDPAEALRMIRARIASGKKRKS
jgi:hypothetical protein